MTEPKIFCPRCNEIVRSTYKEQKEKSKEEIEMKNAFCGVIALGMTIAVMSVVSLAKCTISIIEAATE